MKQTKQDRIDIVNEIIKEIASIGRCFYKHQDRTAYIYLKSNRLYMKDAFSQVEIYLSSKSEYKPRGFSHGGTIWGLTKDFKEFILTGNKCNGENGYGGLYCPHWGYSTEDMIQIQNKATELGYL
jgi:hypothetical protein